jgi:peroxiredoxin
MSLVWVAFVGFALVVAGVGGSPAAVPSCSSTVPKSSSIDRSAQHYATLDQFAQTARATQPLVVDFQAVAHDRGVVSFAELCSGRPTVLVFIRQSCPCSVRFQPVFNRLARAFDGQVQFAGVINGNLEVARKYAATGDVPFPVLADSGRTIIEQFEVKNAAYVALVEADGTLHTLWPGCSVSMIGDLCNKAAALCGRDGVAVDCAEMPVPLTTGCPF